MRGLFFWVNVLNIVTSLDTQIKKDGNNQIHRPILCIGGFRVAMDEACREKNGNLIGIDPRTNQHRFTWQPHGSQFTIIENIPEKSLIINIKQPQTLNKDEVLQALGFDNSWVDVTKHTKTCDEID